MDRSIVALWDYACGHILILGRLCSERMESIRLLQRAACADADTLHRISKATTMDEVRSTLPEPETLPQGEAA